MTSQANMYQERARAVRRLVDEARAIEKNGVTHANLDKIGGLLAGLARRASSPADVRVVVAVLTDAGRQRLAQAAPGHVAAVRALLIDVLTGQQLAAVADGLGEVARRLGAAND